MFVCGENFKLNVKSQINIKKGEEILCDYHWQLAVIDPADGFGESEASIAAGNLCECEKCLDTRANFLKYKYTMRSINTGRFSIWEKASGHVSSILLAEYFLQKKLMLHSKTLFDKSAQILLLSEKNLKLGVGIPEFSWRSVLDSVKLDSLNGGRLVQVSSTLGIEALLAALYKPELELCISVMVSTSTSAREVLDDDVKVALKTFRKCLSQSSTTFQATHVSSSAALSTVITPFPECWSFLGITHLVIGEGADDTPEGLDLEFAKMIIDAAKDTLLYVLTPSNDLQSHLLYKRSGWMVSGYRKKKEPIISSLTGETIFFGEIYKDPRLLKKNLECRVDPIGLPEIQKKLSSSGMQSSANLLQPLTGSDASEAESNATDPDDVVDVSDDNAADENTSQLDNVKVVNLSMLNLTWGMVLADKYFDQSAEGVGFAKPVKIAELSNVQNTLKSLKCAVDLGFPPSMLGDFVKAMSLWFIEEEEDKFGWYSDVNISILTTLINIAIKASPLASECVMTGPYFFTLDNQPSRKWNKCFPHMEFKDAKTILVSANVTSSDESKIKNHYAFLQVDIPGMKITVFDSMPAGSTRLALRRFREYTESISAFVNAMRQEDGEAKIWDPEIFFDKTGLIQTNGCDCGAFTSLTGFYIGMGRCAEDMLLDFGNDSTKMRLFIAALVLDAATEGMPPPAPRRVANDLQPKKVARKLEFISPADEEAIEAENYTPNKKRKSMRKRK